MATSDIPGDIEQTKRRQTGAIPVGIGLTPAQQKDQAYAEWKRGSDQRVAGFKQGVGDAFAQAGRSVKGAAMVPVDFIKNTTFDSGLPDYRSDSQKALAAEKAQQFTPQQQSGGIVAFDMAQRATGAGLSAYREGAQRHAEQQAKAAPPAVDLADPNPSRTGANALGGAPAGSNPAAAPDQPASSGLGGWSRTGIGTGRDGGEIVGRMGANGAPEFSNREADTSGAGAQRAVGTVGDGGISYGEAGDSAMAIDRFERANAIRGEQLGGLRSGGLSDGGAMDRAKERREFSIATSGPGAMSPRAYARMQAQGLAEQAQQQGNATENRELDQSGIDADLDRALQEREVLVEEERGRQEARAAELGIKKGEIELGIQQRLQGLLETASDPTLQPDQRAAAEQGYRALSGQKADYGTVTLKRKYVDQNGNVEEEYLADARTGKPLAGGGGGQGGGQSQPQRKAVSMAEVAQTAKVEGLSTDQLVKMLQAQGVTINE